MSKWPFPGDGVTARARRIASMYRQALLEVSPEACASLDRRSRSYGEGWVAPQPVAWDLDDLVTAKQAADELFISAAAVRTAKSRGRLHGVEVSPGVWKYKVRDVLELAYKKRDRNGKSESKS